MNKVLYIISCVLFLIACSKEKNRSLSEKVFEIAEALPLTKDSAATFFPALFSPGDSLEVKSGEDFTYYNGKKFSISITTTDQYVMDVFITPKLDSIPIHDLSVRMDGPWQIDTLEQKYVKEPIPTIIGLYNDKQQRKKRFVVTGPEMDDSTITRIWMNVEH